MSASVLFASPPTLLFVGERRSKRARRMRVRWQDGRLAAAQLFPALRAIGIDPESCLWANWYERASPATIRLLVAKAGVVVVGMGRIVQAALTKAGIPHVALVHPAARGTIRRRENYHAHVAKTLAGMHDSTGAFPRCPRTVRMNTDGRSLV